MTSARRIAGFMVGLCLLVSSGLLSAGAQEVSSPSAPEDLADLYSPIAYLREHQHPCASPPGGGEPYMPVPVEMVLDNPAVVVRDEHTHDILATGPDAVELATFGPETYLDFPGDPLRPGCVYETDERNRMAELGLVPTIYAKVLFDETEQRLALQYWYFFYYNDWNNTHEGDWEGIVLFWDDVSSVEQALETPPSRTAYAQHGGGEMAQWGDAKIELEDGTRPIVYPAAGAHATFYSNNLYLAWGENGSGFGCDYSSPPSVRVPMEVVLVPNDPDPDGPFAWLLWEGRWGEQKPSMFNGPHGPNLNARWADPWEATDDWRTFSIVVPSNDTVGPVMSDVFCTLTSGSSRLLIQTVLYPWLVIPGVLASIGIVLFFYRQSRDLIRVARRVYQQHWRVFAGIGLVAIPVGIIFNSLQYWLFDRQPLRQVIDWLDDGAGARLTAVLLVGGIQQASLLLLLAPAVIQAVKDIHEGTTPGVMRSYRLAFGRVPAIVITALVIVAALFVPLLQVIGIPIALYLVVRWQFFAQALVFNQGATPIEALSESSGLVRNRWWKTMFTVLIFDVIAVIPGFVIGFGLLALGGTGITFANGISGLLYAITIPLAVLGATAMFLERRGEPLIPAGTASATGD